MAHKKKKLVHYIESRKQKYRHPARYYFHLSVAPRRVLVPHKTTWNPFCDGHDRLNSMLFLSPLNQLKEWFDWVLGKYHGPDYHHAVKSLEKHTYVTFYVHIVVVDPAEIIVPSPRFSQEIAIQRAARPLAIVPIRYYYHRPVNLSRIRSTLDRIKNLSQL